MNAFGEYTGQSNEISHKPERIVEVVVAAINNKANLS